MEMIEVVANDRLGGKGQSACLLSGLADACAVRVKCSPDDTVGDLKKLIAAQKGTKPEKVSSSALCTECR